MKKSNPYVKFIGSNATEVTGSCNLISFLGYTVLVDYGLRQSTNEKEDYKINSKRHKDIKPKKLDAILLTHCHIDHMGLIPSLYRDGATCPTYIPKGTKDIIRIMWYDSVKIFKINERKLHYKILFDIDDVEMALDKCIEVDLHNEISVNEHIYFEYFNAQHIVKSRQIYMTLDDGINVKRIGFTGDISNRDNTYYLGEFEPLPFVDLLVGECTYGGVNRLNNHKDKSKDKEKIDMAIQYALKHDSKILIPSFSLDRMQNVLTTIYDMYDGHSPIKILCHSPLGHNISNIWTNLIDENFELWDKVNEWKDKLWVSNFKDIEHFSKLDIPMLVISSGGFMSSGTSIYWTKNMLDKSNSYIIFCGYSSPESNAGKIKSGKIKDIKIDGKHLRNNAKILTLNSFSSHMDREQLMDYYVNRTRYNKIALVHGEMEAKIEFAKELQENLANICCSSKVITTSLETKINI